MDEANKIDLEALNDVNGGNRRSGEYACCKACGRNLPKTMINAMGFCNECYNSKLADKYNK